ncbi:MAG: hypothetical protein U0441_06250 [Polyangiaceae bacterium]
MKASTFAVAAACALVAVSVTEDSGASFYPPDYPMCSARDTQTTGPFELIKDTKNPYGHNAQLTVSYRGYLRAYYPDNEIHLYIRLNGSDIFVNASQGANNDAYVYLNAGPRACLICPSYYGPSTTCDTYLANGGSPGNWACEGPSADEQDIFFWAFNDYSGQNAWDIEVAAESHGQWDSNWGWNYHGRFEPRTSCY